MPSFNKVMTQNYVDFYKDLKKHPFAQTSTTFVASALLILVLFALAIRPTIITITELQNRISSYKDLNDKLLNKAETLDKLYPQFQAMVSTMDQVNTAVPDSSNFTLFEKQLRYLIQKNNIALTSLSFTGFSLITGDAPQKAASSTSKSKGEDEKKAANIDEATQLPFISFSLNVKGGYLQVKQFIDELEKNSRIATIERISLQSDKKTQGQEVILILRGRIYYMGTKTI